MEKYLTEANWKATGQKHVPPLAKTGVSEALKEYSKAAKLPFSVAGSAARGKALTAIQKVVAEAQKKFPKSKHPKLDAELVKVAAAAVAERKAYNAAIHEMNVEYARHDSHLGKMLRQQAAKEDSLENLLFLEAASAGRSPDELYSEFIGPKSANEVNLNSSVLKKLREKKEAGPLSLADFKGAIGGCEDNLTDTLERLKALLLI